MSQWSCLYLNLCLFPLVHSLRRVWLHLFYALPSGISFNHLGGPLLDSLQYVHMFLVLESAEIGRLIQIRLTINLRLFSQNYEIN